ncbi:MAG: hypothetical protein C3F14_05885 [Deltaproteobacteria bacterium]|nr:MAG: hypothetical protein C3F14_05885 [Deltaproteobacteria bacterium]
MVFHGALESGYAIFAVAAWVGAIFTAASFLKAGHSVFFGPRRPEAPNAPKVKESQAPVVIPILILALLCITFGVFNKLPLVTFIQPILTGHVEAGESLDFTAHALSVFNPVAGISILCLLLALALLCGPPCPVLSAPSAGPSIRTFFSPNGGGTEAIASEIRNARSEVLVQAYSFTSVPIARALLDARKRGVKVTVILDKSQRTAKYSASTFLTNARIPTYIDAKHAIAHNKIIIIDRECVITGSFNFTKAAEEKNAENILMIRGNPDLAAKYLANFEWHLKHSEPYQGRGASLIPSWRSRPSVPRPG